MVLAENPTLRPELTVMQGMLDLRGLKPPTDTAREFRILQGFCDSKKKKKKKKTLNYSKFQAFLEKYKHKPSTEIFSRQHFIKRQVVLCRVFPYQNG